MRTARRLLLPLLAAALAATASAQLRFSDEPAVTPAPAEAPAVEAWTPREGEAMPDLLLLAPDGTEARLSRLRGKVLLIEYAAIPSPVSQGLAGGNLRGGFADVRPDPDVLSLAEVLPFFAKGVTVDGERLLHVTVLVAGTEGAPPTADDARAWARHFGADPEKGHLVFAAAPETQARGVRALAPGFHLVDTRLRLAEAATSGDIPERLRLEVLPALAALMGAGAEEKNGDGALTITLDDLNSLEPMPEGTANDAAAAEQAARTVDDSAGDIEPGRLIQPVTLRKLEPILAHETRLTMVYMFSTQSEASRTVWPVAGALAVNNRDRIRSLRLDTAADEEAVAKYRLQYLPTFVFFQGGQEVGRFGGQITASDIQAFIEANAR